MKRITEEGQEFVALETLVDKYTLAGVLEALTVMCHLKAEHLRVHWQDDATAREWERHAVVVQRAAAKVVW
jgi:hypothetical protein